MRISDWSSDVCSSDLAARGEPTEIDDPFALHEELLERQRSLGTRIGSDRLELADGQRVAAPTGLAQGKGIADALILGSVDDLPHADLGNQPLGMHTSAVETNHPDPSTSHTPNLPTYRQRR